MISRDIIIQAEIKSTDLGKPQSSVCDWAPDAINFLEKLVEVLPWWSWWAKGVAKGAVRLLEELLEVRCGEA